MILNLNLGFSTDVVQTNIDTRSHAGSQYFLQIHRNCYTRDYGKDHKVTGGDAKKSDRLSKGTAWVSEKDRQTGRQADMCTIPVAVD